MCIKIERKYNHAENIEEKNFYSKMLNMKSMFFFLRILVFCTKLFS